MVDTIDVKAHRTASSLNKGALPRAWLVAPKGTWPTSDLGGLHLSAGQCSDCTSAAVLLQVCPPPDP